jgi:hypothetical protein
MSLEDRVDSIDRAVAELEMRVNSHITVSESRTDALLDDASEMTHKISLLEQKLVDVTSEMKSIVSTHEMMMSSMLDCMISSCFRDNDVESQIRFLLDLTPGRDLSRLTVNASPTITMESDIFERLVRQRYDLGNMAGVENRIRKLIDLNQLAPWNEGHKRMIARIITLTQVDWSISEEKYVDWRHILIEFDCHYGRLLKEQSGEWYELASEMRAAMQKCIRTT